MSFPLTENGKKHALRLDLGKPNHDKIYHAVRQYGNPAVFDFQPDKPENGENVIWEGRFLRLTKRIPSSKEGILWLDPASPSRPMSPKLRICPRRCVFEGLIRAASSSKNLQAV
jgi:hypothetical protein